ncbi:MULTISPECIES: LLM class flavin-dependent oxidoreductase [Nocardia]|uniref:LLM class flavin-dependent oxidoreductase n=1 Tax=Nocardia TaxID=1817 RepID=UPI0007EB4308|nr:MULTISPECIES: LLM class flavin-dependent oxidoreductase [Nocardia]MBF6277761.1 LLM class flavin-dependent oxidoreductase [Nocardia nova]OBA52802.1 dehydrogenase [Nocardia sp. 852002-51101_SCH5132738]OBB45482.1 dehydrogenase [Nocardia sp. 852002-51244_SCH5132740]OBF65771.1 dehydrogenase [Mycobacterium sp. 852002-51759_SCH5129042]
MQLGTFLPTSTPDPQQPILGDVGAAARFAEEAGLDSVWSTDHLVASAPILESSVTLATAAAVTERIRIGYGVLLLALRPAAWAAKQIGALQYVSSDRLLLGVGTGNPAHGDIGWRAAGLSFADRGRRTDENLRVLPDLIAGRPAVLPDGTEVTLAPGAKVPPILVAGDGPRARRGAAEFADGWLAIGLAPQEVATATKEVTEFAAEFGRNTPTVSVVTPLPAELGEARALFDAYAEAGVEHLLTAPRDGDWRRGYEFAAAIRR